MLLIFAMLLVLFGSLHDLTAFLWTAPFLGLIGYGYTPLMAAITPQLVGDRLTGSTAGGVNAFWQLGSVLVPAAIGPVFAATGSFWIAFAILAVGPLLGSIAFYFLHEDRHGAPSATAPIHGATTTTY
jgi:ACS family glucarate transporter-like MFS transporter